MYYCPIEPITLSYDDFMLCHLRTDGSLTSLFFGRFPGIDPSNLTILYLNICMMLTEALSQLYTTSGGDAMREHSVGYSL